MRALAIACLIVFTRAASACSTCYGDPAAPQTHGMNMAILFMIGVIGTLLILFAAFFVHLWIRAKRIADQHAASHGHGPFVEVYINE